MSSVQGPLLSLTARGTVGGVIVYRTSARGTTVSRSPSRTPPPSAAQTARRERYRNAVAEWRTLDSTERQAWKDAAGSTNLTGYNVWIRQYLLQNITPPGRPNLP
jgi:hypothetical protein